MSTKVTTYSGSSLGSPPHVKRREIAPNLKRGEKWGSEQNHVLSKEKEKRKSTSLEWQESLK